MKCKHCGRILPAGLEKYCSPQCKIWVEAEKDYETQKAIEAFKKEGEPNHGV